MKQSAPSWAECQLVQPSSYGKSLDYGGELCAFELPGCDRFPYADHKVAAFETGPMKSMAPMPGFAAAYTHQGKK